MASHPPFYVRIRKDLMRQIGEGAVRPGDRLPSERELTGLYGVSRMTVRHGLRRLEQEGYLTRTPGSGTYVTLPKLEQPLNRLTSLTADEAEGGNLTTGVIPADPVLAGRLHVRVGEPVIQIQRLCLAANTPVALETSSLPLTRFPGINLVQLEGTSIYTILRERYQVKPVKAIQTIEAVAAGTFEAVLLGVRSGFPLLRLERMVSDEQGVPVEYVHSVFRGDRYRFSTELRNR